jgi:hypothetical protein
MKPPNEFWLGAHRLAEAYAAEGLTPEERAENITDELLAMPPLVRRQALADLQLLAVHMADLYPIVFASANISEEPLSTQNDGAA